MSKTSVTLDMLRLLATQKVFKIADLSELLETNPRNIIEYKKELEKAGYDIESIPGRYGGYKLSTKSTLPVLKLKASSKKALDEGLNYLISRNDFIYKEDYIKAMGSIYSALESDTDYDPVTIINRFPLSMDESEIKARYLFFSEIITSKFITEIEYHSQKNKTKLHRIHPYKLFMFNNAWFLIAWNESVHDIAYFKLNRIGTFKKTQYTFEVSQTYVESNYIDPFGMKSNLEDIRITLHIKAPYQHIIHDRIYGKDQEIKSLDDTTTELKVTMRHLDQIKAFILGFGPSCIVIEPKSLVSEIKASIDSMQTLYE